MSRYRLSQAADLDLDDILRQGIEQFGSNQTERYLVKLEQTFDYLVQHPEATRLRTEVDPPIRAYPVGAHVIVYEIHGSDILVIRIRSAYENWTENPVGDAP